MKLKSQQYWAIIITLLFHTVLFWGLFFSEMQKSKEKVYEIELSEERDVLQDEKEQKEKEKLEEIATKELQEMMSNKATKRAVQGEVFDHAVTDETQQMQEEFQQQKAQSSALQKVQNRPKISYSKKKEDSKQQRDTVKNRLTVFYVGKSRVEYFLAERYRVQLPIPVYKCEGAGTVEVAIWVNRQGVVINAEVVKERSRSASECMKEAALTAALTAAFSSSNMALVSQQGRIVYQFAAQ